MKNWILGLCVAVIGGAMVIGDVEAARRMGGARNTGTQRNMTNTPPAQQKAAPAQQQQQAGQQQAAPQPQSGFARWAPLLGGLALGGLLGYFMSGQGLGVLLLMVLLVIAAVVVFRMMAAKRRESPEPVQFAGTGMAERVSPSMLSNSSAAALPAGFDAAGFLKGAKMNFIRLQAANDAGRADDIREFTTDEMFGVLKGDIDARGSAAQKTDVVSLDASLVEVVTEGDKHWASVRFAGTIREDDGAAEGFDEVWNLVKPADGSSGWLLAGIQQMN